MAIDTQEQRSLYIQACEKACIDQRTLIADQVRRQREAENAISEMTIKVCSIINQPLYDLIRDIKQKRPTRED